MSNNMKKVLVVDDEAGMRLMLTTYLEREGYQVTTAAEIKSAELLLAREKFNAAITDLSMPGGSGLDLLKRVNELGLELPVIVMSAYGTTDSALTAMRAGAFDYVFKPFQPDEILFSLKRAETNIRLTRENAALRQAAERRQGDGLIYKSGSMAKIMSLVSRVADSESNVLITGESGTGKELVARAIYRASSRRAGPFVAVNCGAMAESILESELFGHVKGSFTGAQRNREGLFRAADGGTLFLDEIGELPLGFQVKLLRAIQFSEVRPIGSETAIKFNARLVAATSRDIESLTARHLFREDLFYRLNVLPIALPPLRKRREDIPLLIDHFTAMFTTVLGRPCPVLTDDFIKALVAYDWPGNVRELENLLDRVLVMAADRSTLNISDLPPQFHLSENNAASDPVAGEHLNLKEAIRRLEEEYIRAALNKTKGNRSEAARQLGLSYPNFLNKIKVYGIASDEE